MADPTYSFSNLFSYVTDKGIVVPDTSRVKGEVEDAFKEKWGANISTDPETLTGRLIEGITMLIVNVLGVNALNASSFNLSSAVGAWLDNIGALFGVERLAGETDALYRTRIVNSNSRGAGFAASIANAIGKVAGVTHVCVLDNGNADPAVLPYRASYGMAVNAHSVFIAVADGNAADIADAIYKTKSLGCAYHIPSTVGECGERVNVEITDDEDNAITTVTFYRPKIVLFKITANVLDDVYTGTDIETSVQDAMLSLFNGRTINTIITDGEIKAAIAQNAGGAICDSLAIQRWDTGKTNINEVDEGEATWGDVDTITLRPYEYSAITASDITVNVA